MNNRERCRSPGEHPFHQVTKFTLPSGRALGTIFWLVRTAAHLNGFPTLGCSLSGALVVTVDGEPHPFDQIKQKYDGEGREIKPQCSQAAV